LSSNQGGHSDRAKTCCRFNAGWMTRLSEWTLIFRQNHTTLNQRLSSLSKSDVQPHGYARNHRARRRRRGWSRPHLCSERQNFLSTFNGRTGRESSEYALKLNAVSADFRSAALDPAIGVDVRSGCRAGSRKLGGVASRRTAFNSSHPLACPSPEALGPGSRRVPRRRDADPPAGAL
jgi:hypothetical protein